MHIRPMTESDIPRLAAMRPGFTSPTTLVVEKTGSGLNTSWRLVERELPEPYDKGDRYDFDATEQANIRERLRLGTGLHLVVEQAARIVGVLDVTPMEWNHTAWVWNIMLDQDVRGQGIGRALFEQAADWARRSGYRALVFETQTNNVPACKFYVRMGCELEGLREAYYSNRDIARGEVALFWVYKLA
ncbi:MAG: GNAT family N-acetyltransferase [Chloroflexi bacterium]|nr:GNAT family N-acetyltransferase [Chloroflexota bacterium]